MASNTYGPEHVREKRRLNPIVERQGHDCMEINCLMPDRWIPAGTKSNEWHLAHDRINGGYRGPAHPLCNDSEGGRHQNDEPTITKWPL